MSDDIIISYFCKNGGKYDKNVVSNRHAAERPSAEAVVLARRVQLTRVVAQAVSQLITYDSTRPVVAAGSETVQRRTTDAAGADKVIRTSINKRPSISSVTYISIASKVSTISDAGKIITIMAINS